MHRWRAGSIGAFRMDKDVGPADVGPAEAGPYDRLRLRSLASVRTPLPDRASQLRHGYLPAVRRIVHRNDRLDVELEAIDVVQQRDIGRIDGCGWRRVGLRRWVERIGLDEG